MSYKNPQLEKKKIDWLNVAAIVATVVLFLLLIGSAFAQDDNFQSNDMNTQTAGNVSTGGNDALGLGFSSPSFGAAVAQCVATEASNYAFGAYGKQKIVVNYWCVGSSLYQMGKYYGAALALCRKTELGDLYPSEDECMSDLSTPPETPVTVVSEPLVAEYREEEDVHAQMILDQQMQLLDLASKYDDLSERRPENRVVYQPYLSPEQRAALAEVKE